MSYDYKKAIAWYQANVGKHTYSMASPRFDCSFSAVSALAASGGIPADTNPSNYSTVTMPALLLANGWVKIYAGTTANALCYQAGDVILMSGTNSMAGSGGAGGHTGLIGDNGVFWNTTATEWTTGKTFQAGKAVQQAPWLQYIKVTWLHYTEIWRFGANLPQQPDNGKLDVDGYWDNATTKALQEALNANVDSGFLYMPKLNTDGIEGKMTIAAEQLFLNKKMINAKLKLDGIKGIATIKAWQTYLGTPVDGVISKPSEMVKALQDRLNNKNL